jgi:hypothetical protein
MRIKTDKIDFIIIIIIIIIISQCPSARCASAANLVCNSVDIFINSRVNLTNLLA